MVYFVLVAERSIEDSIPRNWTSRPSRSELQNPPETPQESGSVQRCDEWEGYNFNTLCKTLEAPTLVAKSSYCRFCITACGKLWCGQSVRSTGEVSFLQLNQVPRAAKGRLLSSAGSRNNAEAQLPATRRPVRHSNHQIRNGSFPERRVEDCACTAR